MVRAEYNEKKNGKGGLTMLESEAMALLVSAVLSYKNREAALALADRKSVV